YERAAPVLQDQLEITSAQRPAGPPAVLDEPVLQDRFDAHPAQCKRPAVVAGTDSRGPGPAKAPGRGHSTAGYGASTARRSGSREPGSTSSTRITASSPAAWRTCLTASPSFARRSSAGSSTIGAWSYAGGPKASTSMASDSAGAGRSAR